DASAGSGATGSGGARDFLLELSLEQLERLHITHALEASAYRVFGQGGAAARLAINPNTLLSRMDKYGIPRPRLARRATKGQGRSLGGDGGRGG
ncbi:MAG: hypothetical protein C0468_03195, partial [Planctomyces sp.]|nr:hypothetical protein [Planctomyces sp.]